MGHVTQQRAGVPGSLAFLRAAGHPLRWSLLGELARSDRQVHELTALLGQPQNLISYHLGQLRKANLVSSRRSTADGRDTYYRLDLAGFARQLAAAGGALHPALRLVPPPAPAAPQALVTVLFLCSGNSIRSPIAEALLRRAAAATRPTAAVRACSAGSNPKPVHPHAVAVMAERGIDLSAARPRHFDEFARQRFDYVITLCDRVREVFPGFPGHPEPIHWSIPDPAREPDGYPAVQRIAAELAERIGFLQYRIAADTTPSHN